MKVLVVAVLAVMSVTARGQSADPAATMHAHDGGTRVTIESIEIPPLTGAPFSATVSTEMTKQLADGTSATVKNQRIVARDSTGRIFQQRKYFSPTGESRLRSLEYSDPNRHEFYDCIVAQRTCYLRTDMRAAIEQMPAKSIELAGGPNRPGVLVQQEELGQKTIGDLDTIGSREIITLPVGQFGNKTPQPVVKEFWYSPRLGLNIVTRRFDPRSGSEDFTVNAVSLGEPDQATFVPPAGYRIVRQMVVREVTAQASR